MERERKGENNIKENDQWEGKNRTTILPAVVTLF